MCLLPDTSSANKWKSENIASDFMQIVVGAVIFKISLYSAICLSHTHTHPADSDIITQSVLPEWGIIFQVIAT